jgi:hypothetical protein
VLIRLFVLVTFFFVSCTSEPAPVRVANIEDMGSPDLELGEDAPEVSPPDAGDDLVGVDLPEADLSGDPGPAPAHVRELRAAAEGPLRAGVAVGFVDGPVGISMAGYGGRNDGPLSPWSGVFKGSRGFYGRPTVKAMVLEVNGERLALVKLPTMSAEASLTDAIVARLRQDHGLELEGRVLTGATHSHHTHARYWRLPPALGIIGIDSPDEEVIDRLAGAFADTIARAVADLGPAEWAYGKQDDWDPEDRIYRDRRGGNGYPKDPRLSLLAVRRPDGQPLATVINFGMHGTVFDASNDLLTEDAAGGLEMKFEELFFQRHGAPIVGMFLQSGGGDASPAGDFLQHAPPARVELIGEVAAPKIAALYEGLAFKAEARLAVRSRRIDLRYAWIGYAGSEEFKDKDGNPYLWGGWQCKGEDPSRSSQGQPKVCLPLETLIKGAGGELPHGEAHQTYLSVARLDDLFLVTLPGEPAYSTIKHLREAVAGRAVEGSQPEVIGIGYSQDHLLYLTHPDDWYSGGYEAEMSFWGPLMGQYLVDRQVQVVDDMLAGYHGPVAYEESPNLSPPTPYTPRPRERSVDPGAIDQQPAASLGRTQTAHFAFAAGDPGLGSPQVVLQVEVSPGEYMDVPAAHGREGEVYDNSRYHMVTLYAPEPAGAVILERRRHGWRAQWEIPASFPAGRYRLRARGAHWDGAQAQPLVVSSSPFVVERAPGAQVEVLGEGEDLLLRWLVPPVAFAWAEEGEWPTQGWRLLDPARAPSEPQQVYAPLLVAAGGEAPQEVRFDPARGAHVLPRAALEGAPAALRVWQAHDIIPSVVEAALP